MIGNAGRRQETMMQRQSRFDQTGHPGGGHTRGGASRSARRLTDRSSRSDRPCGSRGLGPCCSASRLAARLGVGQTNAFEHGVNSVTVALGVAQPFQYDDADFAAGQRAVGLLVNANNAVKRLRGARREPGLRDP